MRTSDRRGATGGSGDRTRRSRAPRAAGPITVASVLAMAGSVLASAACVGPPAVEGAPVVAGDSLLLPYPSDRVHAAALQALRIAEFRIVRDQERERGLRSVIGERWLNEKEVSARVRVLVDARGPEGTVVRVVARRVLPGEFTLGGGIEDRILGLISAQLVETPRLRAEPPDGPPRSDRTRPPAGRPSGEGAS